MPETFKPVLESAIVIYIYFFLCKQILNSKKLILTNKKAQHLTREKLDMFWYRFLGNRVDFQWFKNRFSKIKTKMNFFLENFENIKF